MKWDSSSANSWIKTLFVYCAFEFDLTPLPPDAIEFQSMPKAQCQTCKASFPLQILAFHVKECMESQSAAEDIEVNEAMKYVILHCASATYLKVYCSVSYNTLFVGHL